MQKQKVFNTEICVIPSFALLYMANVKLVVVFYDLILVVRKKAFS